MIIGSKIIFIDKLPSTNSHAASLLMKGKVQDGTVVQTGFQTAGRGQGTNKWESEAGKNLLFSIILFPGQLKAERQFFISMVLSLGIRDFLSTFVDDVIIKWPNDIYARSDKIAGMLIENAIIRDEIEHTIAGIGININQTIFREGAPNATSLRLLTGKDQDLSGCFNKILSAIDQRYRQLNSEKRSKFSEEYLSSLYMYNKWAEFSDAHGLFEGRIISVADSGRIRIEDRKSRIYEYGHGEVEFL
jgi:BirA family biotin operon repressor/biotin-[acetyl-CoA-carboxylase] ligase